MAMAWKGKRSHWATQAEPQTPWQQANGAWVRYRRDPEVRAMWWRLVALGAIVGVMLQAYAEVRTAQRPTVEPYYVYVNQEGQVLGAERVGAKPYTVDGALLEKLAVEWIEQVRSIPLDVDVMHRNWQRALHIATPPTAQRLMAYAKMVGLTELATKAKDRELAVKVNLRNVRSLSERVVRVQWQEVLYAGGGVEKETSTYTGDIEFLVRKPTSQQELEQNALGIWIGRFTWAKDQA